MSLADPRHRLPLPPITATTSKAEATLLKLWGRVLDAHPLPPEWWPALSVVAGRYPHAKSDKAAARWTGRDLEAFAGDWIPRAEQAAIAAYTSVMPADHMTPEPAVALRALAIMLKWRVRAGVDGGAADAVCASHYRHLVNLLRRSALARLVAGREADRVSD